MAEATYLKDAEVHDKVTAAIVASGEIIQLADGRAAVYQGLNAAAVNDRVALRNRGIFNVTSASGTTFAVGAPVYWDDSASLAIAASGLDGAADFYLGRAVYAKTSGQLVVSVDLNAGSSIGSGIGGGGGLVVSVPYVFDCETGVDSAVHTLIPASANPNGLQILSVIGIVVEVFAGTEDQGVVTLRDTAGSPATICTLTPSDAGADAVKDVIQAVGAANAIYSALGVSTAQVPAGLGVTGAVTTPTTGSAAGKMRVHILAVPLL